MASRSTLGPTRILAKPVGVGELFYRDMTTHHDLAIRSRETEPFLLYPTRVDGTPIELN
jgi:hypothetical protein